MRKNNILPTVIIFAIIFFLVGFLSSVIVYKFNLNQMKFSTELNPLHAISILTSVGLAIYVSIFFNTNYEKVKAQREIKIKYFDKLESYVRGLEAEISNKSITLTNISTTLKKIGKFILFLEKINEKKCKEQQKIINTFKKLHKDLRREMTYTPITKKDNPDIVVKNNLVMYSDKKIQSISLLLDTFDINGYEYKMLLINKN